LRRAKIVRCCGKKPCLAKKGPKNKTTTKLKTVRKNIKHVVSELESYLFQIAQTTPQLFVATQKTLMVKGRISGERLSI
jgi:hypothetical protein